MGPPPGGADAGQKRGVKGPLFIYDTRGGPSTAMFRKVLLAHRAGESRAGGRRLPAAQPLALDAHRLGGNADVDVMVEDRPGDDTHRADHGVAADRHPGEDDRVIGDARAVADHGAAAGDALDVLDVVSV